MLFFKMVWFQAVISFSGFITIGAEMYTYTEIPLQSKYAMILRQVQVRGPALLKVDKLFFSSVGPHNGGNASIVFAPVGSNVSHSVKCVMEDGFERPVCGTNCNGVSIIEGQPPMPRVSVIRESGAYHLYLASCSNASGVLTFSISSANLGAHEDGWWMYYAGLVLFYLAILVIWMRMRPKWRHAIWPVLEMEFAYAVSLFMAVAGLLRHAVPEKNNPWLQQVTALSYGAAVSSFMVALVSASALGVTRSGSCHTTAYWGVLLLCFSLFWRDYGNVYENGCDIQLCDGQWRMRESAIGLLFCFFLFGSLCIRDTIKSIRHFQAVGQGDFAHCCQKLAGAIVIYSILFLMGLAMKIADVPTGTPNCWGFHFLSELLVGQFTHAFGIVATMCIFSKVDWPADDDFASKEYAAIDGETVPDIPDGNTDEEDAEINGHATVSPVTYGSQVY